MTCASLGPESSKSISHNKKMSNSCFWAYYKNPSSPPYYTLRPNFPRRLATIQSLIAVPGTWQGSSREDTKSWWHVQSTPCTSWSGTHKTLCCSLPKTKIQLKIWLPSANQKIACLNFPCAGEVAPSAAKPCPICCTECLQKEILL